MNWSRSNILFPPTMLEISFYFYFWSIKPQSKVCWKFLFDQSSYDWKTNEISNLLDRVSIKGRSNSSITVFFVMYLGLFNLNILTKSQARFIYNVMKFDNLNPSNYYKYKEDVTSHSRLSPKWIYCKIRSLETFYSSKA